MIRNGSLLDLTMVLGSCFLTRLPSDVALQALWCGKRFLVCLASLGSAPPRPFHLGPQRTRFQKPCRPITRSMREPRLVTPHHSQARVLQ